MDTTRPSCGMSRRNFMTLAGGAAGLAALAALGFSTECTANIPEIDFRKMTTTDHQTHVLVVGSGIAGLFAAVKAHDAGADVIMVSKGRLGSSGQTPFARGIFAYDPATATMDLDTFTSQVSHSAMGTNNPVFTRQMAEHSLARVKELESWGFFKSPLYAKSFAIPIQERKIPVMERIMLTHLVREKGVIAGAAGFSLDEPKIHFFRAKTVVLCTGAGGFKPNGFPICDLTHDGSMMAYRIGAKITGKEWNDGHGANLKHPADVFGQWGPMLQEPPNKVGVGIRHDLGMDMNYQVYRQGPGGEQPDGPPPDHTMQISGGPIRPAGLHQGPPDGERPGDHAREKNPGGRDHQGPPPGMGGIPSGGASAGLSIHKSEGLVPFNSQGASNIPGLYAAGDALGSHMAGGIYTQIGSSLAGSAVQGAIAGEAAARYAQTGTMPSLSSAQRTKIQAEMLAPLRRDRGYSPAWITQTLQSVMIPNFVLYIKKESLLKAALTYVEELRDHHQPMLKAADLHELRLAHETANMILNAEMKLRASLMRKESRCSHFRLDYPQMDTKNWNAWINIYRGKDGSMQLEKQPFGTWPA
ncbi:FAD-dependent oxidoreductase [Desulfoplanes formicivorans]|uniref:Fumarate reductase n=1 Tax=Desulfoplanes formicivorans TaxID=1592317 RepID=A0A194AKW9_9BACT|nr:FAD-binding protein [Desulfoplanes formicivorans]GAU09890.1 fumarate reductase [Desulfoplanes formicivorans]